jgi:LuxR family maltose regulon positive regulatory protein
LRGWGDLPSTATAYGYLGWLAFWKGDPRRARDLLERCIAHLLPNDWGIELLKAEPMASSENN